MSRQNPQRIHIGNPKITYFDTSAVNHMHDLLSIGDAAATKAFQEVRGREWRISPVTIWEVLLTRDRDRKESLLYFSQHLFARELMPSPEEMLIKYVEAGCPEIEKQYPLVSNIKWSKTWRALSDIKEKTYIYDQKRLNHQRGVLAGEVAPQI
jgi:hypothetical protein